MKTISLHKGVAQVTAKKEDPAIAHINLSVAGAILHHQEGQYTLESNSKNAWGISVVSGSVDIIDEEGSARNLRRGERLSVGDQYFQKAQNQPVTDDSAIPLPPTGIRSQKNSETKANSIPKTAVLAESEMLAKARRFQAKGDLKNAAKVLRRLISRKQLSEPSRIAMLSLGQIYMRLKQPRKALDIYTGYLQFASPTLAQEAKLGQIDALHALGKWKHERNAIEAFLERHPASPYADPLRRRLQKRAN